MGLFKIAWRNIQQRALSSSLTALSMALGVALVVAVLVIYGVVSSNFERAAEGYNLIVGAKGGKLQLVLNTVYHLSQPIENIPWNFYNEFRTVDGKKGQYVPLIDAAIPYCLGDNYKGYRVVGTTSELFTKLGYGMDQDDQPIPYQVADGRLFKDDKYFEGVIGSVVARTTGLKVGDSFQPTHGVTTDEEQGHKHDPIKVVGILAPTGTPNDRALFMNIEGFFLLEGHAKEHAKPKRKKAVTKPADHQHDDDAAREHNDQDEKDHADKHDHAADDHEEADAGHAHDDGHDEAGHEGHDHAAHEHGHDHDHDHKPLPADQREVTAILIRTSPDQPIGPIALQRAINKGNVAQAVTPVREIQNLFAEIVGPIRLILLVLACLVVVVAGIGVMVSIYNSMNDRQRDIAIMRSLGAGRNTVMLVILCESLLLAVGGGLGGVLLGHGVIALLNPIITAKTGVSVGIAELATFRAHFFGRDWLVAWEGILVPALVALSALVGFLPAMSAYRTDVAKALSASP